jgi:hypothetical protein
MADQINESKPSSERNLLPFDDYPELIFGLVGPIGVDLESVSDALAEALDDVEYKTQTFRVTELMREVNVGLPLDGTGYIESFQQRIAYANKVREQLGRNDALAILAHKCNSTIQGNKWRKCRRTEVEPSLHYSSVQKARGSQTASRGLRPAIHPDFCLCTSKLSNSKNSN